MRYSTFSSRFLMLLALLAPVLPASGQTLAPPSVQGPSAEETPEDPFGRSTPEGTVRGFVDALAEEDFERAARYLDLTGTVRSRRPGQGEAVARRLAAVLDRHGEFLPRAALNNTPDGESGDGLEPELDQVGRVEAGEESVPLLVERIAGPAGPAWVISTETLQAIPATSDTGLPSALDTWLPRPLGDRLVAGAPLGHWIAMVLLGVAAYAASSLLVVVLGKLLALWRKVRRIEAQTYLNALGPPLKLLVALVLTANVSAELGISIVVRDTLGAPLQLIGWIVLAWLLIRVVDAARTVINGRLVARGHGQAASVGVFVGRVAKALILSFGFLAVLDTLGFDVTTAVAALGIGGIALALGAQKLVENFVGSVSVLADRPVAVGEFCKIGTTIGTVQEIGIRSTKLRTLENTLVVIPNSEFASRQLENYSRRSKFWFHPLINIDVRTPPALIERFLQGLRDALSNSDVFAEAPRVRLLGLEPDRLPVEVFGYVATSDHDRYLEVQEAFTLQILRLIEEIGIVLAAPGITVYGPPSADTSEESRTPPAAPPA